MSISVITIRRKPIPTIVYNTYWKFACERQNIFFNRINEEKIPWTYDRIFMKYKFTNAYRASDRVSQFLIKNVIYKGDQTPNEVFFRIILFKIFNKIETWEYLEKELVEIRFSEFNFDKYVNIFQKAIQSGKKIYSGAYIMASAKSYFGYDLKFKNHLKLIELFMKSKVPHKIIEMKKMEGVYDLLKSFPSIGNFLAYQYTIDLNYSNLTSFNEMEFVAPGPGAIDGISKCFRDKGCYSDSDIIRWVTENQESEFSRLGLGFKNLWGRPLQLIDCQNLFCEVDKYSRIAHPDISGNSKRKRIKQQYNFNPKNIDFWYPPKWGINSKIKTTFIFNEELSWQYC